MKELVKKLSFTAAFFIFISLFACNTGDKKSEKKEEAKESKDSDVIKDFLGSSGKYAVLKLSKNDLVTLFGGNGVQKLLIEFTDNNDAAAPTRTINAIAYAARPSNEVVGNSVYLLPENIASPNYWDTTGVQILGNNEFSRKDARKALGNVNVINATTAKDLYFYPIKKSDNHIAYIVSKDLVNFSSMESGSLKTLAYPDPANSSSTNPSPPYTPCTSCDN